MRWQTPTALETEALGGRFARARPAVRELQILYLCGDLGAGKTTFARGFLQGCGITGAVRSPTYTLVERYETPLLTVVHLDLYRLHDPSELEHLGVRDWALPGHLWLIEWPERGSGAIPDPDLRLALAVGSQEHLIEATAATATGEAWLARVTG
jgi:tRNA threonylcarbamoyladenosine biosynthesis protein TsaE